MVLHLPVPRRTRPTGRPGTLSAAAEQLRRHGWRADEIEYDADVDPDLRLRVAAGAELSAVELLLCERPCGGTRWQAVRVGPPEVPPGDRAVWSGPAATCSPEELVAFLECLLLRPERDLVARYERLG